MLLWIPGINVAMRREGWLVHLIGRGADRITIECWLEEDRGFSRRSNYRIKREMALDSLTIMRSSSWENPHQVAGRAVHIWLAW